MLLYIIIGVFTPLLLTQLVLPVAIATKKYALRIRLGGGAVTIVFLVALYFTASRVHQPVWALVYMFPGISLAGHAFVLHRFPVFHFSFTKKELMLLALNGIALGYCVGFSLVMALAQ